MCVLSTINTHVKNLSNSLQFRCFFFFDFEKINQNATYKIVNWCWSFEWRLHENCNLPRYTCHVDSISRFWIRFFFFIIEKKLSGHLKNELHELNANRIDSQIQFFFLLSVVFHSSLPTHPTVDDSNETITLGCVLKNCKSIAY